MISIIIPAKNEAACLPVTIREWQAQPVVSEIVVVDGYSSDGSKEIAAQMGAAVAAQQGGPGYGRGVMTGLKHIHGDYVSFIDADGSYDPQSLPAMLALLEQGNDVVFCSRYMPGAGSDDDTWVRLCGNKLFTACMRLLYGVQLSDALFLYVLARKEVFTKISMQGSGFEWCLEFPIRVHQAGLRYCEIPSRERPRRAGESKVHALKDGLRMLYLLLFFRREAR